MTIANSTEYFIGKEYLNQKLCYVTGNHAFFSKDEPTEVVFEDGNDVPYEHNSSTPYSQHIVVVFDNSNLAQPCDGYHNSPYSTDSINSGAVAWLRLSEYAPKNRNIKPIMAGTTLAEFIERLTEAEIEVYIPLSWIIK